MYYKMNCDIFQNLVLELILFLQSQCLNLVRPQVKIRKIFTIFFNKFTHEQSATHMVDCLIVSASIIKKCVDIICDVFTNHFFKNKIKLTFQKKSNQGDNLGISRIDRFAKHMWI